MPNLLHDLTAATALVFCAMPSLAQVPGSSDGEWVTLTGKVESASEKHFILDYGERDVVVELDDHRSFARDILLPGDRVTVTGRIDDDFYELRKIEASSALVEKLNKRFRANADDEEEPFGYPVQGFAFDDDWLRVTGVVVSAVGDQVVLDTGPRNLTIDTTRAGILPRLDPGERITVYGRMNGSDLFERQTFAASSVEILAGG